MVDNLVSRPYLLKGLEKNVVELKELVDSTMHQVHSRYALHNKELSDDKFQSEVIAIIKSTLGHDFFAELDNNIHIWTAAREGTIKQYFKERVGDIVPERFLKVAVKYNSLGGNEVLINDLEPWVDSLSELVSSGANRKYLRSAATRKQVLANLHKMIAFPVSIKEIPVKTHLSENAIDSFLLNESEKYLPPGAIKLFEENKSIQDILIVSANVLKYKKNGVEYRIEARVKASESMKWAKYIVGLRNEAHYDGIGVIEVVQDAREIIKNSGDVLLLKNKKSHSKPDYRFPLDLNEQSSNQDFKQSVNISEQAIMELLKTTYMTKTGDVNKARKDKFYSSLIYGSWIDMKLQSTKAPIEIQVKDTLGSLLYTFNSPFGHNSRAYHGVRSNELNKKVKIGSAEYSVNKIAEYVANEVFLPAFALIGRL